jgi:hypothetical protein
LQYLFKLLKASLVACSAKQVMFSIIILIFNRRWQP